MNTPTSLKKNKTSLKKNKTSLKKNKTSLKKNKTSLKKNKTSLKKNKTSLKKNKTSLKKNRKCYNKKINGGGKPKERRRPLGIELNSNNPENKCDDITVDEGKTILDVDSVNNDDFNEKKINITTNGESITKTVKEYLGQYEKTAQIYNDIVSIVKHYGNYKEFYMIENKTSTGYTYKLKINDVMYKVNIIETSGTEKQAHIQRISCSDNSSCVYDDENFKLMVNKFKINLNATREGWSPKIYKDEYEISKVKPLDNCCCYRLYYLSEWLDDVKTLNDIVKEEGYQKNEELKQGLIKFKKYIESANYIHGDLNFGNVLVLNKDNSIKLIDFENSYFKTSDATSDIEVYGAFVEKYKELYESFNIS